MTLRPWRSGAAAAFAQREAQQPRQHARQAALHYKATLHARGRRAQSLEVRREQCVPGRVRGERPGEGMRQPAEDGRQHCVGVAVGAHKVPAGGLRAAGGW